MLFQKTNAKDSALYHMLSKYWFHLVLLSILVVWLFDVFYVADGQKNKTHKVEKVIQKQSNDRAINGSDKHTLVSALSTKTLPLFATVTLPSVPTLNTTLPISMTESELAPQILTRLAQASAIKTLETKGYKVHTAANQVMPTNLVNKPTGAQVKNVIKQLTGLNNRHIQFLLPERNSAKEAFVNHMYKCENMQFGVITKVPPYQLTLLSNERVQASAFQPSELLRVAHDFLNRYERNLFTLYAQGDRPVRLFDMSFDINLATKIAAVLGENKLQSFSARYFLERSQIGLTEIVLNHRAMSENWIMSSKKCY
ncbi:hypothetical protein [Brumicola pallidula]|uniref:Uncharacterized protein n=1 Tax=Brumicola pallidula DSM 14239 = ACAM 615 TaxID=1121922 RepID=K7A1J9_9ALTE|nr:hypothetical protein [Glaciecola pallidula]GAC29380.1 hypothetical protein GPAL_2523 [Glaciecola pallidula DSM 14239 = ACAM 615]